MKNLFQHEKSHKFSHDALLLAQFAPLEKTQSFVELGTGCGIIALEVINRKASLQGIAIDYNEDLIKTAKENKKLYQVEKNILFIQEDLENCPNFKNPHLLKYKNSTDLIITNPPWLLETQGKLPQDEIKRKALFGNKETYNLFFKNAKYFAKEKSLLALITIPQRITDTYKALEKNGFLLKEMQCVHNKIDSPAIFILMLAEFKGKLASSTISDLKILPPVIF